MKSLKVCLLAFCAEVLFVDLAEASGFLSKESLATDDAPKYRAMPEVRHKKSAGDDYAKGSPYFKKQETRKAKGVEPNLEPATGLEDPEDIVKDPAKGALKGEEAMDLSPRKVGGMVQNANMKQRTFFGWLPSAILVFAAAFIWQRMLGGHNLEGYAERSSSPDDFTYKLFSLDHCFGHHANVCLCAWCCPQIRMADTYSKRPSPIVSNFWVSLLQLVILWGLVVILHPAIQILTTCIFVYFRQKLRAKYGIKDGGMTYIWDCFYWLFCPCCTAAQEARQVEFVGLDGKK